MYNRSNRERGILREELYGVISCLEHFEHLCDKLYTTLDEQWVDCLHTMVYETRGTLNSRQRISVIDSLEDIKNIEGDAYMDIYLATHNQIRRSGCCKML